MPTAHDKDCTCKLCDPDQVYDPPWLRDPKRAQGEINPKEAVYSWLYGRRCGKNAKFNAEVMAALDKMMRDMQDKGLTFNVNEAKKRIEVQPGGLGKFLQTLRDQGMTPSGRTIRSPIIGFDPGYPNGFAVIHGYAVVEKDPYEIDDGVRKLIDEFKKYSWDERKRDANHWKRDLYGEWPAAEGPTETLPAYSKADVKATLGMYNDYHFDLPDSAHLPGGYHNPEWAAGDTINASATIDITAEGNEPEMDRREVLAQQLKALQEEQAVLDRFPRVDNFADGTVLRFNKVFGGSWEDLNEGNVDAKVYYFAAIKCEGVWYLSGNHTNQGKFMRWGKLVEWLADSVQEVWLMVPDVDILSGNRTIDGEVKETPVEAEADASVTGGLDLDKSTGVYTPKLIRDEPQA